jgi:hypothetical protein
MPDSPEEKKDALIPEPQDEVIQRRGRGAIVAKRNGKGRFEKKELKPSDAHARDIAREFLFDKKDGKIRLVHYLEQMGKIIEQSAEDPKFAGAGPKALQTIVDIAGIPKVKETDAEREAKQDAVQNQLGSISITIQAPQIKHPQVESLAEKKPPAKPSWIEPVEIRPLLPGEVNATEN